MRYLLAILVLLSGCKPSAEETSTIFINSINSGDFAVLDDITGQGFLDERITRCKFLESLSRQGVSCEPDRVVKRWDKFVRDLNLYMAPCRWEALEYGNDPRNAAADIICGGHRDVFQLWKDDDGWRLKGIFQGNMVELGQQLILERMYREDT
jgi:hypothetical protein